MKKPIYPKTGWLIGLRKIIWRWRVRRYVMQNMYWDKESFKSELWRMRTFKALAEGDNVYHHLLAATEFPLGHVP